MITMNNAYPAPKTVESYRVRKEAMDAAVYVIGPHARHGFEYETSKVDGRWIWRHTDEIRPDTPAELKANGGKKSLMLASTPMAHVGTAKPVKLPVPPRRTPPQAQGKPAGAPDGGAGGEQPPSGETPSSPRSYLTEDGAFLVNAPADDLQTRERMLNDLNPACNGLDVAPQHELDSMRKTEGNQDPLALPAFLKREKPSPTSLALGADTSKWARDRAERREAKAAKATPAPAKSGTYDELKEAGALRSEPVAKPVGTTPVSRKAAKAKTAPKTAKRASKAPTKTAKAPIGDAEHFGPATFKSKAALIKAAILDWKDDEAIVQEVRAAFPGCEYKASDIKWYRRKMEKAKA